MITKERKAEIARENGAKSKGPKTEETKAKSARNAITHGLRATALKLIVPPHSACLANEDRQAFYHLFDILTAKYRPADESEQQLVREIADTQWKINRNKQMESAIYNRELLRQAARVTGTLPELRELEIAIAAQEALTGNKTILELRKDTQICQRSLAQLQRRLIHLQHHWPAAEPVPPPQEPAEQAETNDKRTDETLDINGPVTPTVVNLYRSIFQNDSLELVGNEPVPDLKAA